jgi:hypothetical protein
MTPAPEELFDIIQSVDTYLMALTVTPDARAKRAARTILRVWRAITLPPGAVAESTGKRRIATR